MTKHRDNFEKSSQRRFSALYAIPIVCCLLLAGIVFICFRLRGGVQVKAPQDGDILSGAEAVLYRQDDERWGKERLGDSEYTMASSGCLVSCIASALSMEGGEEETPGSLNEKFSGMQAYDAEGNLQWQPLSEGGEYQVDVYGEISADIIDACLSQEHYPIVRVRMYALGNIHYVLIVGAEDGEYLCMDPLRDEITRLSDYGSRVYAVRCVYYGEQSPQKEENAENAESMDSVNSMENTEGAKKAGIFVAKNPPEADLNRNGIPEELRIVKTEYGEELEVWENGERLLSREASYAHVDQKAIFLCRLDGADYLLQYYPTMYQGYCEYSYDLITMEEGYEMGVQWNEVSFDINFGSPIHGEFDPKAIAAFMEEVNELLAHSILLINTDSGLQQTFEREGRLTDTLWWLDSGESGFRRDSSRSLLENLQDFEEAMTQEEVNTFSQSLDMLPITHEMEMRFSYINEAGDWRTILTLNPDGSFTGYHSDLAMGEYEEDYPDGTLYFCDFYGKFGEIKQISDASFSLTLEELVTDPVGEERIEDRWRYVSSEPWGFVGADGAALKPGASFLFYTPEATGQEPGTELYGAKKFLEWWPERRKFVGESDKLGRYGLYNLETGHGFFSEPMAD